MSVYKDKIRVRACGVLKEADSILLVQLESPVTNELIWMPPGGSVEPGESYKEAVKREFSEETGIIVQVADLIHLNEMIQNDFHAIELYFEVFRLGGKLKKGFDPELQEQDQIIHQVQFLNKADLPNLNVVPEFFKGRFWEESVK